MSSSCSASPVDAPVLRFRQRSPEGGQRVDGAPLAELATGCPVRDVVAPAGGPPLTVLRGRDEVRACLTGRRWVMAGVTDDGRLRGHPLTGAERQDPDGGLLNMDPPAHRTFRGRINHLFTPAAAAAGRSRAYAAATELAGRLDSRATADLVAEYVDPFIATMVCHSLGLPEALWPQILASSVNAFAIVDGPHEVRQVDDGWRLIYDFYSRVVSAHSAEPHGTVAGILRALDGFGHWQQVHVLANVSNGYPAAMPSLRRVMWELLTRRRADVAAGRSNAAALTAEILNTVALFPVALPRRAAADTRLGERLYPRGSIVLPSLVAAARDPRYPAPAANIAFGYGPHTCPGAALTRLWLTCAVEVFFEHYPHAELVDADPVWDDGTLPTPRDITVRLGV